jgi:hypothetical protein
MYTFRFYNMVNPIYHAIRPEILIAPLDKFNGRDRYSLSDPMSLLLEFSPSTSDEFGLLTEYCSKTILAL